MNPPPNLAFRHMDWDYAQVQYETTTLNLDEIGRLIGVYAAAIAGRASRFGWYRDRKSQLTSATAQLELAKIENERKDREDRREVIERVNIEMQAKVLATHRTDIKAARDACTEMWRELTSEKENYDLMDRSNVMKRLTDSMKTLILLERQAYGIQTVFEDPTQPQNQSVAQSALDLVMNKFVSVLQKQNQPAPVVIDGSTRVVP